MKKIAIVLFNLGGPDKPESVKPFLFNLFNDPAIIGAPNPIRWCLAKLISTKRDPVAREIYSHLGGGSPIMPETIAQADALVETLNEGQTERECKAYICMRYWHPMSKEVVASVKEDNPDEIILLPLYPQFSTTTSGSSLKDWHEEAERQGLDIPTKAVCCYPTEETFIKAHASTIKEYYDQAKEKGKPRILFSAHGLPKKIITKGDPYQWQVEQTSEAVVKELGIDDLDYNVCYQSKVGPLEWIGPSTDDEIERAAEDKVPVVIVPIAFVSEHSETLVELDIEYREMAEEEDLHDYFRVPTLSANKLFIESLAKVTEVMLEKASADGAMKPYSHVLDSICPKGSKCCLNERKLEV